MRGYVARKGDRWYAVIYEGLDPVTSKERRRWHPAGTSREEAEQVAERLAAEMNGHNDDVRSLTFGAYLTNRWLSGKRITLAQSTWDGYRRKVDRHILPAIGHLRIRRLRAHHLERLYDRMLHPTDGGRALAPKTVLEVHLIIRGALNDAVTRGLVNSNVALVAHSPRLRSIPKVEPQAWTAQQLQAFLQAAAGHRLFPAFWLLAATGMRRSELLGLRWDDVDFKKARVSVNRGLVAVAYELHESRGKTRNSRRSIDLDPTTINVMKAWRDWQAAEQEAAGVESEGWVFTNTDADPSTLIRSPRPSNGSPTALVYRESDSTTSGTLTEPCSSKPASRSRWCQRGWVTVTRPSQSTPTSTSFPGCKPKPPEPSSSSSKSNSPEPPVERPVEEPHNTVEALASNTLARAFSSGGGI